MHGVWNGAPIAFFSGMGTTATPIREHLVRLEERISRLSSSFMSESDDAARADIQREIHALEIAVDHYRSALGIEERLHSNGHHKLTAS